MYSLQKEGEWEGKIFRYKKYVGLFEVMFACLCKCYQDKICPTALSAADNSDQNLLEAGYKRIFQNVENLWLFPKHSSSDFSNYSYQIFSSFFS